MIKVLPGLDSLRAGREKQLRDTLESLKTDANCAAAFRDANVQTISEMTTNGIVIGPAHLLSNPNDASWVGITERARSDYAKEGVVGSTGIQAVTLKNWPGYIEQTLDSRARIFLNGSAFRGGKYSLREVLVHEFLHVAGWRPEEVSTLGTLLGKTDLSHYEKYEEIMAACK